MKPLVPVILALFCAAPGLLAADVLPVAVAQAPSEAKTLQAFKRSFSRKKPASIEQRTAALAQLAKFDSQKVAKALVDAHVAMDEEILAIENQRVELLARYASLRRGREYATVLPKPVLDEINAVKRRLQPLREQVDELHEMWSAVRAQIGALVDPPAVRWLVTSVLASKRHSLLLKLEISKLAGSLAEHVLDDLERVFMKAKAAPQIVALLKGLQFAGPDAARIAPQVLKHLSHADSTVREHAAYTLAKMEVPEAIEPLIDLLQTEEGRAQDHIASALQILTRQKHGVLVDAWRRWFADEKDKLLAGEAPLGGGGMFERRQTARDMGYYFDIAMDGKSIMYIIDASGSMKEEIELALKDDAGEQKKQTRLEACKAELVRALGMLESDAEFNIIWYNDIPYLFSEKMVAAKKADVKRGQEWVSALQPISYTNIYDSMKMAFDLAGQGAKDKYYSVGLDTIFLLTDGSPTKPDGSADSTQKIIEAVREWNALKRITIHAIGIGQGINAGFLQTLANENNGEFRQYDLALDDAALDAAAARIRPHVHRTPVMTSSALDAASGARLFFKCENLQRCGAFKMRGAANAVFSLSDEQARRGVVTHSSGNHAGALALAARTRGIPAYVVMPHTAPEVKKRAVEGYGAQITYCAPNAEEREAQCAALAERTGGFVVPPFDHPWIIAGQATAARELLEDHPDLDCIITPVGGGGLLSGTALSARRHARRVEVFGAEAAAADTASRSLRAGAPVAAGDPETVCDGLRTSLGQLTYPIVAEFVTAVFPITEEEIVAAMRSLWERTKLVTEASGAVAFAAILANRERFAGARVGVVLSGGNVDLGALPW